MDIFYSHRPDPDTPFEETMGALHDIVRQGKALYVGISNYNAEQTKVAVDIHQPRYSMFDRWVEDGLLDVLEEKGIGCIPFSPLAQGLLTDRYLNGIPDDSRIAKEWGFLKEDKLTEEYAIKIQALNNIANTRGQSLAQMALSWILRDSRITSVLVGASSVDQLKDNLKILGRIPFSDDEIKQIDKIIALRNP